MQVSSATTRPLTNTRRLRRHSDTLGTKINGNEAEDETVHHCRIFRLIKKTRKKRAPHLATNSFVRLWLFCFVFVFVPLKKTKVIRRGIKCKQKTIKIPWNSFFLCCAEALTRRASGKYFTKSFIEQKVTKNNNKNGEDERRTNLLNETTKKKTISSQHHRHKFLISHSGMDGFDAHVQRACSEWITETDFHPSFVCCPFQFCSHLLPFGCVWRLRQKVQWDKQTKNQRKKRSKCA